MLLDILLRSADFRFQLGLQLVGPLMLGDLAQHHLQTAKFVVGSLSRAVLGFGLVILGREISWHEAKHLG